MMLTPGVRCPSCRGSGVRDTAFCAWCLGQGATTVEDAALYQQRSGAAAVEAIKEQAAEWETWLEELT